MLMFCVLWICSGAMVKSTEKGDGCTSQKGFELNGNTKALYMVQ